jgi:hypothetical protein
MARYVKVTWKSENKMLATLPPASGSKNADESAMSCAIRELLASMGGNNFHTVDLESIRFSIEED